MSSGQVASDLEQIQESMYGVCHVIISAGLMPLSTHRESLRYSVMEGTFVNTDPCFPQKNKMRTCFKWF